MQQVWSAQPLDRFDGPESIQLAAVRGALLVATPGHVTAFNTSGRFAKSAPRGLLTASAVEVAAAAGLLVRVFLFVLKRISNE